MRNKIVDFGCATLSARTYGEYSDNYGTNCLEIGLNGLKVFFSYETPVAFHHPDFGLVVRQNSWGPTTGKHLNWIDGGYKEERVDDQTFREKLDRAASITLQNLGRSILDVYSTEMITEELASQTG